jgi:hypothetical protein
MTRRYTLYDSLIMSDERGEFDHETIILIFHGRKEEILVASSSRY